MSKKWKERVAFSGSIKENIDYLLDLEKKYPGKKYKIVCDQDNEYWIVDTKIEEKEESSRIKMLKKQEEALEKKELSRLIKKYRSKGQL